MITMALNPKQKRQIELQVKAHAVPWKYTINVPRAVARPVLRDLVMYPGVLQPLSSGHFGRFLHDHPEFFEGKSVLDMGCGSGALGIIMAKRGARKVVLADIDENCCANTRENVRRFRVGARCEIIQSDLFDKVPGKFGLIVFAHPYFGAAPVLPAVPVTRGMLDDGGLISRFLDQAKSYLNGPILMPYLHLAGKTNDPSVQGPRHGYKVEVIENKSLKVGYQKGEYSVYSLLSTTKFRILREK